MSFVNRLKQLAMVVFALFLTACAASNVKKDVTTEAVAAKNNALLIVSISQTKGSERFGAAQFLFDQPKGVGIGSIRVETFDEMGLDALTRSQKSDFSNEFAVLKVIEVPAGTITLDRWRFSMGQLYFEAFDEPLEHPISLKPGEVVYIGNLHLKTKFGENFLGMNMVAGVFPEIRDEKARDLALLKSQYPQLSQVRESLLPTGPWLTPEQLALWDSLQKAQEEKAKAAQLKQQELKAEPSDKQP